VQLSFFEDLVWHVRRRRRGENLTIKWTWNMKDEGMDALYGMRTRREIADSVIASMFERGLTIDQDPEVWDLIRDWTEGLIDMPECRQRYLAVICQRRQERRAQRR
jgi:hypothetical protein